MNVQKTKTRQQIADEYGVSRKTLYAVAQESRHPVDEWKCHLERASANLSSIWRTIRNGK